MSAMRVVLKLGTSVLTAGTDRLHRPRLVDLMRDIAAVSAQGHEVVLVSSGAVTAGKRSGFRRASAPSPKSNCSRRWGRCS